MGAGSKFVIGSNWGASRVVGGSHLSEDEWGHHMWDEDWAASAACRDSQPDALFVRGAAQNQAKAVCAGCPVRTECLAEALDNQIEWGVWGGMTERERRALLRRNPNTSWRGVLTTARAEATRRPAVRA